MPSKTGTKPKPRPATPQMDAFVTEYIKDWHGTNAAIRVGVSPKAAATRASLWLKHPEVAAEVKRYREAIRARKSERVTLASERTLQAVADVAYFDPREFVKSDGSTKNLHELSDQAAMAVAGFETETNIVNGKKVVTTKYRLVNRVAALDMAAKVTGEYARDNEQRRSSRDMTDEEIRLRILELMGQLKPAGAPLQ